MPWSARWRFADRLEPPDAPWTRPDFDDAGWIDGATPLGFGRGGERTLLPPPIGRDDDERTTYLRRTFAVADPARVARLRLRLVRDDGAVVYLNGTEILRSNVAIRSELGPETPAATAVRHGVRKERRETYLPAQAIRAGTNVLAVEVHQAWVVDSDLRFDLELAAIAPDAPLALQRGPYVQRVTPGGATLRWRTNRPAAGRVLYGPSPERLSASVDSPSHGVDHEVAIEGLAPATRYAYAVASGETLLAGDPSHFFVTAPPPGTAAPLRVWVLGDSGTGDRNARAVRDGFRRFAAGRRPDVWLMLGDNAYPTGSDAEHQIGVFDTYPEILRNTALWAVLGNHDAKSSDPRTQTGPFFDAFTLPTRGEAGGAPSASEAYYAFDHGNAHFVALDSEGSRRKPHAPMLRWLRADLEAAEADWLIAYWHRAVLTQGTSPEAHSTRIQEIVRHVLPPLEAAGVDLVLAGHSHNYERSVLLAPSGGDPARLGQAILDPGDGDPEGDGAYAKRGGAGMVFVVAGSSGQTAEAPLDHPAMVVSLAALGSLVLDIEGCALDGRFVDRRGRVRDRFRIEKGPPCGAADAP